MLAPEEARRRLAGFRLPDWRDRRLAALQALPAPLCEIGRAALPDAGLTLGHPQAAERLNQLNRLDALAPSDRRRLFGALFPGAAAHLDAAWLTLERQPYQAGWRRKAFRAPNNPELTRHRRSLWLSQLLAVTAGYEPDMAWLAAWAPYLGYGADEVLGLLFAAAIERGDEAGRAVLDTLLASARGEHPIGAMGRHVTRALLTAGCPAGWDFVERLLVAAQRQEGLRQVILESVDEAHPAAFRRMLHLILDQNLVRFSATVRAADVWFGLGWDVTVRKIITSTLERALRYLDDGQALTAALESGAGEDAYLALWALAYADAPAAIGPAARLLQDAGAERRFAAAHCLGQLELSSALEALLPALDDADLRIAAHALQALRQAGPARVGRDLFERVERNLPRFPARPQTLPPLVWPWMTLEVSQAQAAGALVHLLGQRSPARLIPHLRLMPPYERSHAARLLGAQSAWDSGMRAVFCRLAGDASRPVREAALEAIREHAPQADEIRLLEGYLRRQAGDLRRGVLTLLLAQPDAGALASAGRLLAGPRLQRLAGLELLRELKGAGRQAEACRAQALDYQARRAIVERDEITLIEMITAGPPSAGPESRMDLGPVDAQAGLDDALGLLDPAARTRPRLPSLKGRRGLLSAIRPEPLVTPAARALRASLDALVHARRETPLTVEVWRGKHEDLLGNLRWAFPSPEPDRSLEADLGRLPLREMWEAWWAERPAGQRDRDGLEILRALALGHFRVHQPYFEASSPAWLQTILKSIYGQPDSADYPEIVDKVLAWLLRLHPPDGAADFLLDAVEATFARLPPDRLVVCQDENRPWQRQDWRDDRLLLGWLTVARQHRALRPQDWSDAHHTRLWGLLRWLDEPGPDIPRHRPSLEETLLARQAGAASEADLLDLLLGPRAQPAYVHYAHFHELHRLSGRRPNPVIQAHPELETLLARCRARILNIELARGDLPTAASAPALSLRHSGGLEMLARVLAAFPAGRWVRGWTHDGVSRDVVFSHLVRASFPADQDTRESFAARLQALRVSETRLIELAMYAPQWAGHVEHTLGWPGLADAVWWLHAHTKDHHWRVEREVAEAWAAAIAERTPLSSQDLLAGAVDVAWFRRVYTRLGQARWGSLLAAVALASGGLGHTRARLFAEAMTGAVSPAELIQRFMAKRHQDSVRALGLAPLAGNGARDEDILGRYRAIQEFRRGSRKFGSQRQESEKVAARLGLENLARTAGYPDPVRLEWAMESRTNADLARGPLSITVEGVCLRLSLDELGEPHLRVTRGEKVLKAIPARLKKAPPVQELIERRRDIERQRARMRASLEQAMCRGDAFTGAELRMLLSHPVLAPLLSQLVFIGEALAGYPVQGGAQLEGHDGCRRGLPAGTRLRIAHPHDLLAGGAWHLWQRECFVTERVQPFKQVFRELYLLTAQERDQGSVSGRYAGHQVNARQAAGLLTARGWVMAPDEGPRRIFHDEGLAAWLSFQAGAFTPLEVEAPPIAEVTFGRLGEWKPLDLEAVPPRVFSEVMRDVDLVVSVAHAGGVDPEASASTVAMRTTLVRETCARLRLENVRLEGRHALVDGCLGHYSVHLGSAVVHRQPGGALCIVPVHGQHHGRLFLPFADDDPKTAEVVSKVLLLARDQEIRDPTILEQIRATA